MHLFKKGDTIRILSLNDIKRLGVIKNIEGDQSIPGDFSFSIDRGQGNIEGFVSYSMTRHLGKKFTVSYVSEGNDFIELYGDGGWSWYREMLLGGIARDLNIPKKIIPADLTFNPSML